MAKARLVLGTGNRKKRQELQDFLDLPELELLTLDDFSNAINVVEDGDTFLENAKKKASQQARTLGEWVLGEDSGLVVDALDGRPGIFSARYAGEPCDDDRNNAKLLHELQEVPDEKRIAHYVCTMAVADPTGEIHCEAEGRCFGRIARSLQGQGGFGYDPLFLIPEKNATFGELPASYKREHSHRAAAAKMIRPLLIQLFELEEEDEDEKIISV